MLLAIVEDAVVGYGSLVLESHYQPFRKKTIPEINNLVVASGFRSRGIGTSLITALEDEARRRGFTEIGIGYGLYADYGPAQRLYFKLGYVPDGLGATYHYAPVTPGAWFPIDDDLVLWMTKPLDAR